MKEWVINLQLYKHLLWIRCSCCYRYSIRTRCSKTTRTKLNNHGWWENRNDVRNGTNTPSTFQYLNCPSIDDVLYEYLGIFGPPPNEDGYDDDDDDADDIENGISLTKITTIERRIYECLKRFTIKARNSWIHKTTIIISQEYSDNDKETS